MEDEELHNRIDELEIRMVGMRTKIRRRIIRTPTQDLAVTVFETDDEPTQPRIKLPKATVCAPWWRRLYWWMVGSELSMFCSRCHARIGSPRDNAMCHVCLEFESFNALRRAVVDIGVSPDEAAYELARLRRHMTSGGIERDPP